jgi:hypothetical protein
MRKLVLLLLLLLSVANAQKSVHVRQYTRKNGTVVAAHDRRAPGTAPAKAVSKGSSAVAPSPPRTPAGTTAAPSKTMALSRQTPPGGTPTPHAIPSQPGTRKTVQVHQYTRKDGTVVAAYDRRAPATGPLQSSSSNGRPTTAPSTTRSLSAAATATNRSPSAVRRVPRVSAPTPKSGSSTVAPAEHFATPTPPAGEVNTLPRVSSEMPSSAGSWAPARAAAGETYTGPRGGQYHYSASGKKAYSRKRK